MAANQVLQKSIGRIMMPSQRELDRLDDGIDTSVRGSPLWREKENLLASVPGIGKVIARTLLAETAGTRNLDRRRGCRSCRSCSLDPTIRANGAAKA